MVISIVLFVMAYDYPPKKLSVYLFHGGCSNLTFYALLEASHFFELWISFCKKLKVEPTSLEAYFQTTLELVDDSVIPKIRGNKDNGGGKSDEGGEDGQARDFYFI
ncbi:hypothetical protein GOBAR_DD04881 [Gossypium barbadense]|nr:hypothetical protein GOBAR_DD04881 [Gossypium barbadense]